MTRRLFIIGNPYSGGKKLKKIKQAFTDHLHAKSIDYDFYETENHGPHPIEAHFKKGYHSDLVIIGGDGTINEAVNALDHNVPIGIIQAGTGNDFVKNINIGKSLQTQFQTAIDGQIAAIDLGSCNGRKFTNGIGIGFDGQIVEDMANKRVPLLKGFTAYYYHVLHILASYQSKPFEYVFDGGLVKKNLILLTINNGTTFGGGFKLAPNAKIDDGFLNICEIGDLKPLRRFLNIHRLTKGTHNQLKEVNLYQTKTISIKANPLLFAHIDGERLGNPPFEIQIMPKALDLRVASV